MKTVATILKTCELNDLLSDGVRTWKVTELNLDGAIVAQPHKWNQSSMGSRFELWSCGVESVAVIPKLKKIKKN